VFRKANPNAMEAVKATITKLKAERERFFREEGSVRRSQGRVFANQDDDVSRQDNQESCK